MLIFFRPALGDAVQHADGANLLRIARGFPEFVAAYMKWMGNR
jgi:hypothetical protein